MKIIVTFSGGKDSLAALLWVRNNMSKKFTTVFCDTGWESDLTYKYIDEVDKKLQLNIVTLISKKYSGMIDLAEKRGRFPSSQRRFCTSELKSIPMIDYLLDEVNDDFIVVQGIRSAESASRAAMNAQCNYFKYYINPYKTDKNGKPKFHTYRRQEILKFCEKHATDVLRPIFDWSAQQVIDYILENGLEPNPLYHMGMKRVGCFPCVMNGLSEIHQLARRFPERIAEIAEHERRIKSSFFTPNKIPSKYYKGAYPLIEDVVKYANMKYDIGGLFEDNESTTCMSYYGLCE